MVFFYLNNQVGGDLPLAWLWLGCHLLGLLLCLLQQQQSSQVLAWVHACSVEQ